MEWSGVEWSGVEWSGVEGGNVKRFNISYRTTVYMIQEARKNCWFTFQPCLLSSLIKSTLRQPTGLPTNNETILNNLFRLYITLMIPCSNKLVSFVSKPLFCIYAFLCIGSKIIGIFAYLRSSFQPHSLWVSPVYINLYTRVKTPK